MAQKKDKPMVNFKEIALDKMVKADWNYKNEHAELSEKLVSNIKRNGQIENLLVRELDTGFYEVVNGNHRYDALKTLGWEKAIVYDLGKISLAQAQRIAIETNETKFSTDVMALSEIMGEIANSFDREDLLQTMPYSGKELDNMLDLVNYDFEADSDSAGLGEEMEQKEDNVTLTLEVPPMVFEMWQTWKDKVTLKIGYESASRAFEFAMAEALDTQDDGV
jgi:ParB-like chromosome segregation protein Spo0J